MERKELAVGQTLLVSNRNHRERKWLPATVETIGTKLVALSWPKGVKFKIVEQCDNGDPHVYEFLTEEQLAEQERREAALATLRRHGLMPDYRREENLPPVGVLARIADLLEDYEREQEGAQ